MSSRYVRIDFRDGELVVLAADEPGSPGQTSEPEQEQGTILMIPHFPHVETIRTGDLANGIQVVGGQMRSRDLETETARRLNTIRGHHSVTLEYIRMGMLRGLIKDGRGRTLYDLYNVFGITKKQVDFKLGTASTNILSYDGVAFSTISGNVGNIGFSITAGATFDAFMAVLVLLIQFIGWIAFVRGLLMIKRAAEGSGQASYGTAITHILGGILSANLIATVDVLQQTMCNSACIVNV